MTLSIRETVWHAEESLVNSAANAPDLPVGPSERSDVAHPHHGGDEVPEEHAPVGRVGADDGVRGAVVEELLVGMEESSLGDQVGVVGVVESVRGCHVQRREVSVAARPRAVGLPPLGEGGLDVGIVVDAVPEGGTTTRSERVRAGERHQVPQAEPLVGEAGHEGG